MLPSSFSVLDPLFHSLVHPSFCRKMTAPYIAKTEVKTIAVCGATGQQGGATLQALLKLGHYNIKALTRNPSGPKAAPLATEYIRPIFADFNDRASLEAAFDGCDAVFAVTDFWKGCGMDPAKEVQQGKNLVDAAKAKGVSHFVFSALEDTRPTVGDALKPITGPYPVPHFDAKGEVDAYLRSSGLAWTSLFPTIFFQNLLPVGGMGPKRQPDGTYVLFQPTGGVKLGWCSTDDIGHVAARVLTQGPEKWGGKTVGVVGAYATLGEVAAAISKATGKKVVAEEPSAEEWLKAVTEQGGMPEAAAKDMANMFEYYARFGDAFAALRPLEGTKTVYPEVSGLDEWAEANKDRFIEGMQ